MASVGELLKTVKPEEFAATISWRRDVLGTRGRVLPIGKEIGGAVVRDFSFRRPDTAVSLEVGEIKAREDLKDFPGQTVAEILTTSLDSLLGAPFAGDRAKPYGERLNMVRGLAYVDVAYLVFYRAMERRVLRRAVPAPRGAKCPLCKADIHEMRYDLAGTVFPVWDWTPGNAPRAVCGLSEPWGIGDKSDKIVLGSPAWHQATAHLTETDWTNDAAVDVALAAASIVAGSDGVEGGPMTTPHHSLLGTLLDWDRTTLVEGSRHVGGEIMPHAPFECSSCHQPILVPMSWRSVGFF